MSWYRHKVERDLERWKAAGWVSEAGAGSIRADLAAQSSGFGAPAVFAILGAILFGCAIISFVAAHWSAMSKLARLSLLLAALWGSYGAVAWLFARRLDAFAHAAVLIGIAVFGGAIMLIAQMYHMEGNPPDAVLFWALGALLAAVAVRSAPALAATFLLAVVWTWMERSLSSSAHWPFLVVWGAATAAALWLRWRPGLHVATLALIAWLVGLGFFVLDRHAHWIVVLVGLALAGAAVTAAPTLDRVAGAAQPMFAYALAIAFAGLFTMQFIDDPWGHGTQSAAAVRRLLLLSGLTLVLLLAAMYWALATGNRGALWIGYGAFALELFALYWRTLGTLLDTSLFFLVAALLVGALAYAAWRLHEREPTRAAA